MNSREEPYSKFQNATVTSDVSAATALIPIDTTPAEKAEMEKRILDTQRQARYLAIVEMIASCLVLFFGVVSTALGITNDYWMLSSCTLTGCSVWAPVLGIIAAGLGLAVLKRQGNADNKCLLIAHFVMSILGAVGSGILVIFTSVCLSEISRGLKRLSSEGDDCAYCPPKSYLRAYLALEVLILLGALVHMILCIISSALMCRYWCCCGRKSAAAASVIYIPNPASGCPGELQAITVPSGAKIVLLSGNNVQNGQSVVNGKP